ncbi:hypothetical protein [Rossellomorea aquimaris]|uniref:hypothetical protein n=1 Tax=Rossellomorea aquimaris TaxID=189382 RepID=UPI001CFE7294|nr:hypothetical protein [Rossellomorea aquimaris]
MDSSTTAIFQPDYIFALLIFFGVVYLFYVGMIIAKMKLTPITIFSLVISILTYALVGIYMTGKGMYIDENPNESKSLVFYSMGFLELILLTFPYIFLTLAASLGEKKERNNT